MFLGLWYLIQAQADLACEEAEVCSSNGDFAAWMTLLKRERALLTLEIIGGTFHMLFLTPRAKLWLSTWADADKF